MCRCNPSIKTPLCGRGDCRWSKHEDDIKKKTIITFEGIEVTIEDFRETTEEVVSFLIKE